MKPKYLILLLVAIVMMAILNPDDTWRRVLPKSDAPKTTTRQDPTVEVTAEAPTEDWDEIRRNVEEFRNWISDTNRMGVNIEVVRPTLFAVETLDATPTHSREVRFGVTMVSGERLLSAPELKALINLHHDAEVISGQAGVDVTGPSNGSNYIVRVSGISGRGALGLSVARSPMAFYDVSVRSFWPIHERVRGTKDSTDGQWLAYVGNHTLAPGDVVRPSETLCGFQVLDVMRDQVWFVAFYGDQPKPGLSLFEWPRFVRIRFSLDGQTPERLELRTGAIDDDNRFLRLGEELHFPPTQARMKLEQLWRNAVRFRYQPGRGGDTLDLLSVLLTP